MALSRVKMRRDVIGIETTAVRELARIGFGLKHLFQRGLASRKHRQRLHSHLTGLINSAAGKARSMRTNTRLPAVTHGGADMDLSGRLGAALFHLVSGRGEYSLFVSSILLSLHTTITSHTDLRLAMLTVFY
jgi:hypothetical protein